MADQSARSTTIRRGHRLQTVKWPVTGELLSLSVLHFQLEADPNENEATSGLIGHIFHNYIAYIQMLIYRPLSLASAKRDVCSCWKLEVCLKKMMNFQDFKMRNCFGSNFGRGIMWKYFFRNVRIERFHNILYYLCLIFHYHYSCKLKLLAIFAVFSVRRLFRNVPTFFYCCCRPYSLTFLSISTFPV